MDGVVLGLLVDRNTFLKEDFFYHNLNLVKSNTRRGAMSMSGGAGCCDIRFTDKTTGAAVLMPTHALLFVQPPRIFIMPASEEALVTTIETSSVGKQTETAARAREATLLTPETIVHAGPIRFRVIQDESTSPPSHPLPPSPQLLPRQSLDHPQPRTTESNNEVVSELHPDLASREQGHGKAPANIGQETSGYVPDTVSDQPPAAAAAAAVHPGCAVVQQAKEIACLSVIAAPSTAEGRNSVGPAEKTNAAAHSGQGVARAKEVPSSAITDQHPPADQRQEEEVLPVSSRNDPRTAPPVTDGKTRDPALPHAESVALRSDADAAGTIMIPEASAGSRVVDACRSKPAELDGCADKVDDKDEPSQARGRTISGGLAPNPAAKKQRTSSAQFLPATHDTVQQATGDIKERAAAAAAAAAAAPATTSVAPSDADVSGAARADIARAATVTPADFAAADVNAVVVAVAATAEAPAPRERAKRRVSCKDKNNALLIQEGQRVIQRLGGGEMLDLSEESRKNERRLRARKIHKDW